jgi:hypothetical protein
MAVIDKLKLLASRKPPDRPSITAPPDVASVDADDLPKPRRTTMTSAEQSRRAALGSAQSRWVLKFGPIVPRKLGANGSFLTRRWRGTDSKFRFPERSVKRQGRARGEITDPLTVANSQVGSCLYDSLLRKLTWSDIECARGLV